MDMNKKAWRILLVDDDEDDYILVRDWLAKAGRGRFELQWAASAEQAFQSLEAEVVDAVLLDYDLGAHTGLDFARDFLQKGCQAPVIMFTGRGSYEVDLQAMSAGVFDFLRKGEVTPQLLERSIRYAIERKKTEEDLRRANEQLARSNDELEERVQKRTQELIRKNEALMAEIVQRRRIEQELAEVQRRLLDRVEGERLELAQELHDGPLQELYGAAYQLSEFKLRAEDQEAQAEIGTLQERLQQLIQSLRSMAGELRPPALAPFGLERAIRSHAEQFAQLHPSLQVKLELAPDEKALTEQVRLVLFRIYQVGLINVVRHAQASQVTIRFRLDKQQAVLEIEDNGCGFKVPKRWFTFARKGHLGLVGAAERAEAVGGRLEVVSERSKGTRLLVVVPR